MGCGLTAGPTRFPALGTVFKRLLRVWPQPGAHNCRSPILCSFRCPYAVEINPLFNSNLAACQFAVVVSFTQKPIRKILGAIVSPFRRRARSAGQAPRVGRFALACKTQKYNACHVLYSREIPPSRPHAGRRCSQQWFFYVPSPREGPPLCAG